MAKSTNSESEFIRLPDVSAMLKVPYQQAYRRISSGELPARRLGMGRGYLAVSRHDLPLFAKAFGVPLP